MSFVGFEQLNHEFVPYGWSYDPGHVRARSLAFGATPSEADPFYNKLESCPTFRSLASNTMEVPSNVGSEKRF